jgi:hypothetical protein
MICLIPQITLDWVHKSAKCHFCGRFVIIAHYVSPGICGFAICGSYLRTDLDLENKESVHSYTSDRDLGYGYSSEDGSLIIIFWLCQLT